MPLAVTVLNKQRRVSVELSQLETMMDALAKGIFAQLRSSPANWLKLSILKEFEKRGTLSVILVSDRKIRQVNREWRGKDSATDVLSFPLAVQDDHSVELSPGEEELELGELIISMERTVQQAEDYGHTFEREFAFLFVHGVLHVLGFDHLTKVEEKDMFGRQAQILASAGITR
jgi:probable rRNA maturation factor